MFHLSNTFLKSVKNHVGDCANPIQLRTYLNKYQSYLMSDEIKNVFYERIEFFEEKFAGDSLFLRQCEDLRDDLELNAQIANVCKDQVLMPTDNFKKMVRSTSDTHSQEERDYLIYVFTKHNGNKSNILIELKISNNQLNDKIAHYNLKETINRIRRDYRGNNKYDNDWPIF